MRSLARPLVLVARPAEAFLRQWPRALAGDAEGIHQARVATRRLREALPLLERHRRDLEPAVMRAALRSLTRALGPIRELDVSRVVLAEMARREPAHAAAAAVIDRRLGLERRTAAAMLREMGERLEVDALIDRTRELAVRLDPERHVTACAVRAGTRLTGRAQGLRDAVLAAGRIYAPGPLHTVRIALKKFRYCYELAGRIAGGRHSATLRRLKGLQDVLGDMHDLQVLAAHVRDAGPAVPARRQPAIEALAGHIDTAIRDLHSGYVTKRMTLVAVLARAMRLARQLEAAQPAAEAITPPAAVGRVSRRSRR